MEDALSAQIADDASAVFADAFTPEVRRRAALDLCAWLDGNHRAPAESGERLEQMRKRIHRMCEKLELRYESGELVVKASGDAETVLRTLELGSDWFPPAPVIQIVLTVLA